MKKHLHKIAWVEPGSIAEELGLEPGDAIEEINGNEIEDIFDYQYYVEDEYLDVLILTKDGEECVLEIEKDEDEDLGITFESSLWTNIIPAVISVCSVLLIKCRRE